MGNLIDGNKYRSEKKSSFEKLVIARLLIKKLQVEHGVMQSTIDELEHELKKLKGFSPFTGMLPEDKLKIKQNAIYEQLQDDIKRYKLKNKQLNKDNSTLIYKLHNDK